LLLQETFAFASKAKGQQGTRATGVLFLFTNANQGNYFVFCIKNKINNQANLSKLY